MLNSVLNVSENFGTIDKKDMVVVVLGWLAEMEDRVGREQEWHEI